MKWVDKYNNCLLAQFTAGQARLCLDVLLFWVGKWDVDLSEVLQNFLYELAQAGGILPLHSCCVACTSCQSIPHGPETSASTIATVQTRLL